jgi:SAM-dependent methyltransferase
MYSLILFLILLSFSLLSLGAFFDAPWVPTRKKDFERVAKMAKLQPGMSFYDLGSGTGEMLFHLSDKYKVNCVGIEISPILYLYSKAKSLFYKRVKIIYGDFYRHDISKADIIYVFLMPKSFNKLKRKISKELKENSKIIMSSWPLQNFNPTQISKKNSRITYYLYKKSALS